MDYYCYIGLAWSRDLEVEIGKNMEKYSNLNDHSHDFEKVIFGLGDTGLSIARHLYSQGDSFCVYDAISDPPRLSTLRTEMPEISFYYGETPSCFSSSSCKKDR